MYALLTGKAPFRGEAIMKVLMATMHEPHETVTKVRPDVSQTFSDIIDKCLDKKQDNATATRHSCSRPCATAASRSRVPKTTTMTKAAAMSAWCPACPWRASRLPAAARAAHDYFGWRRANADRDGTAAKSKTGLYVAGAAAVLIIAGGIGFAFMKKGGDPAVVTSGTNAGVGTGTGTDTGKIKPPSIVLSDKQLQLQKNMHANNLKLAKTAPGPAIWIRRRRS